MFRSLSLHLHWHRLCLVSCLVSYLAIVPAVVLAAKVDLLKACAAGDVPGVEQFIRATEQDSLARALTAYPGIHAFGLLNSASYHTLGPLNCMQVAAAKGFVELLDLLKAHHVDVNGANIKGFTPLHLAARFGAEQTLSRLLDYGANINARDIYGNTPLLTALEHHHPQVAEILVNHGADLFLATEDDTSAVHLAAARGYKTIVARAIVNQVPLHITNAQGETPLLLAARNGRLAVVKQLLDLRGDKTVNRDSRDKTGRTPLMWAAVHNHSQVISELIYKGASRILSDKDNHSALTLAVKHGQLEAVKALVARAGWGYLYGMFGPRALAMAMRQQCTEIEEALTDAGVEYKSADSLGVDRLYHAALAGLENRVEGLIMTGYDVDGHGELNPLTAAVCNGHVDVVETLLRYGARPEWGGRQRTPLMEAVDTLCRHVEDTTANAATIRIVELLLKYGARVDRPDPITGQTPLYKAVAAGNSALVRVLRESKARPEIKSRGNRRPIDVAIRSGNQQIITLLQDSRAAGYRTTSQRKEGLSSVTNVLIRKSRRVAPLRHSGGEGDSFSMDSLECDLPVFTSLLSEKTTADHN